MPVSLAPSPLYSQQRMAMPSNYYNVPTTSASSMALQAQAQVQQPNYDSYAASTASAVSVPPPVQHRASSGAWTPQDDQQLLSARMQGLNWGQIQANFFPTKTPNACRKRHERLMERKGSDDWDNQKLQRLAREYMSMRKEIWSGLAARTGEKWNVVEQKVRYLPQQPQPPMSCIHRLTHASSSTVHVQRPQESAKRRPGRCPPRPPRVRRCSLRV